MLSHLHRLALHTTQVCLHLEVQQFGFSHGTAPLNSALQRQFISTSRLCLLTCHAQPEKTLHAAAILHTLLLALFMHGNSMHMADQSPPVLVGVAWQALGSAQRRSLWCAIVAQDSTAEQLSPGYVPVHLCLVA